MQVFVGLCKARLTYELLGEYVDLRCLSSIQLTSVLLSLIRFRKFGQICEYFIVGCLGILLTKPDVVNAYCSYFVEVLEKNRIVETGTQVDSGNILFQH